MKRRTFLKTTGLATLAMATGVWSGAAAKKRRPNILFIITDQQFADAMSCEIGDEYINTPAMDSLAATGMRFARAYCANPLCVPSRTSMFTGHYPHATGIQTNSKKGFDVEKFPLMGALFRDAGYDTGYTGKWHIPFDEKKKEVHGFDFIGKYTKGKDGDYARVAPGIEFIKTKRDKPFLLVVSCMNPHNICQWARGEALPDGAIGDPPPLNRCPPLKANHLPPKGETDIIALTRRSYQASRMFPVGDFDDKKWREYVWAYYRMVEMVDGEIGKVLAALRETGQEEDTLVLFLGDHGDCHGAHKWNQKTVFYDEASRVPFIISRKGVTKPGVSNRLAHTGVDLIPTFCDFAGIETPKGLPGLSLKKTALGRGGEDPREYLVISNKLVQGAPIDGHKPEPGGRMVRSQRYKYCAYDEGERRESLVDMEKDPGEMVNLAGSKKHRKVLEKHRQYLAEFSRKHGDDFAAPGRS